MSDAIGRPKIKKFKKSKRWNSENGTGKVLVRLFLEDPNRAKGQPKKGNVTKSISIANSTVLDVFDAIEKALF